MRFGDGLEAGADQRADSQGSGLRFRTGPKMCHSARVETKESSAVMVSRASVAVSRWWMTTSTKS